MNASRLRPRDDRTEAWRTDSIYGGNLAVLRDSIATESVDLIYLDPPFNSSAGCRLWSKGSAGTQDVVQIEDFDESEQWHGTVRETQPESLRS